MAEQYWIRKDGGASGPFSAEQVSQMAAAGELAPGDQVSTDGTNWTEASSVPGLFERGGAPGELSGPGGPPSGSASGSTFESARASGPAAGRPRRPAWLFAIPAVVVLAGIAVAVWLLVFRDKAPEMKYAPPGTMAAVHVDVEALRPHAETLLAQAPTTQPADAESLRRLLDAIDYVEIYLVAPEGRSQPTGLGVLGTDAPVKELLGLLEKAPGGRELAPDTEGQGNGRYAASEEYMLIDGGEADDLADGVVLVGHRQLLAGRKVSELGGHVSDRLKEAAAGVDASAPLWAAASLEYLGDRSPVSSFSASLHIDGETPSKVVVAMRSEEVAKKFVQGALEQFTEQAGGAVEQLDVSRSGRTVTISFVVKLDKIGEAIKKKIPRAVPGPGGMPTPPSGPPSRRPWPGG